MLARSREKRRDGARPVDCRRGRDGRAGARARLGGDTFGADRRLAAEPQDLVELVLASEVMMCLLWGRQAIQIYNDAYAAGIGARHPLGDSAFENFADVLPAFEPLFERARVGETAVERDLYLHFARDDVPRQETWFDLTYSPLSAFVAKILLRDERCVRPNPL
jgi:hypothetical protein